MSCQNIIERIQPGTVTDFHYSFFISPRLGSTDFLCKFLPRVRGGNCDCQDSETQDSDSVSVLADVKSIKVLHGYNNLAGE